MEIGDISQKEGEPLFEWNFPIFFLLWAQVDDCITSPRFHLSDSSWYLTLYPNGCVRDQSKGWLGIYLHRTDIESIKCITYTLGIDVTFDRREFTRTVIFNRREGSTGNGRLLKMPEKELFNVIIHVVKVTCQIYNHPLTLPQVTPIRVPCAIQTEIPDSVSRAKQREVPDTVIDEENARDENESLLDTKETPNRVSCAIQTEIPDSVSCAIQTEVPDTVIDEENARDENESLLDTKEDAILRDGLKKLLTKGSDYDVTICVQDKEFRAHRNILSARSPVFAMMLAHDTKENKTGTIKIEDCDPESFDQFLLYVYSGRMKNMTPTNALHLYYTADKYDFPVLKERCVNLLKTSLSITSICDVVLLAAKHQERELLEEATEFFARNMEQILVSCSWQTFMIQNPGEANELYIKSMKILVSRK